MKDKTSFKYICFALCLSITMVLMNCGKSVQQQVTEQLELGYRYLEEEKYEEAIVTFQEAIAIDEKCTEAYTAIAGAYVELSEVCAEAGDYDRAIQYLEEGLDFTGDETVRQKLISYRPELSEEDQLPLQELYVLMQERDFDVAINYLSNHHTEFQVLFQNLPLEESYLFDGTDMKRFSNGPGMVIGAETSPEESYFAFYGNFVNGKPDGDILYVYSDISDRAGAGNGYWAGEWKNGHMEGQMHEEYRGSVFSGEEAFLFTDVIDGICTHNVIDGTETVLWMDSGREEHRFQWQIVDGRVSSEGSLYDENMGGYYVECTICGSGATQSIEPGEILYTESSNPWIYRFGN